MGPNVATAILPFCLWLRTNFPPLPGSRLMIFYRDARSALLQLVNQWLNLTHVIMPSATGAKTQVMVFTRMELDDFRIIINNRFTWLPAINRLLGRRRNRASTITWRSIVVKRVSFSTLRFILRIPGFVPQRLSKRWFDDCYCFSISLGTDWCLILPPTTAPRADRNIIIL